MARCRAPLGRREHGVASGSFPLAGELDREALPLHGRDAPGQAARPTPAMPRRSQPGLAARAARRAASSASTRTRRAPIEAALAGRHVVVATPDGERQEPLLPPARPRRRSRDDPDARALYLYPDEGARARSRGGRSASSWRAAGLDAGAVVYDGDTPGDARRAARERARIVLTNPDMLHAGHPPAPRELGAHAPEPALRRRRRAPHLPRRLRLARRERPARASLRVARFHGSSPHAPRRDGDHRQPARARGAPLRRRRRRGRARRRERRAARRAALLPLQPAGRERRSSASARAT